MMLKFPVGYFLDRPNYCVSIIKIEEALALYCVDLTWNDPFFFLYHPSIPYF